MLILNLKENEKILIGDKITVMVVEIRDRETAQVCMEAAMTGHLVFSTIHTNDAPSAVSRLTEMGVPAFMVATTIKCVIAQRLCRRICTDCKTGHTLTPDERRKCCRLVRPETILAWFR